MNAPKTSDGFSMTLSAQTLVIAAAVWGATVLGAYVVGSLGRPEPKPAVSGANSVVAPGRDGGTPAAVAAATDSSEEGRVRLSGADDGESSVGRRPVRALVDRAMRELSVGGRNTFMNIRALLRTMAPLADLTQEEVQEALQMVDETKQAPQMKGMFMAVLLSQWAESDPVKAMAYAEAKSKDAGQMGMGMVMPVVQEWAKKDPAAVWDWYLTQKQTEGGDQRGNMALHAIFSSFANQNLDGALNRLESLDEGERGNAIGGIGNAAADPDLRDELIARLPGLKQETATRLRQSIVHSWISSDTDAALAWVDSLPEQEQKAAREAAGGFLLGSNPRRGAEVLLKNAPEKDRPGLYARVASQWSHSSPTQASQWLMEQPQGPELDQARSAFAGNIVNRDPKSAMEWAKSVMKDDVRDSSVSQVYGRWAQKDEVAATKALRESGIPVEKQEQLIKQRGKK